MEAEGSPPDDPCEPPCEPPAGDELPDDDPEGSEAPPEEPELPEGMPEGRLDEPPDDPEEPPDEDEDDEDDEEDEDEELLEDDCWLTHPPMSNAAIALASVPCAVTRKTRRRVRFIVWSLERTLELPACIVGSPGKHQPRVEQHAPQPARGPLCDPRAERMLTVSAGDGFAS